MSKRAKQRDVEKEKYWRRVIREGVRSGLSIREFCRQKRIKEGQFYAWRRELKQRDEEKRRQKRARSKSSSPQGATFALVTDGSEAVESAGIELVLGGGRRLRIGKGVDRETLASVLAVLEEDRC